jgi:hypothetical protein
MTTKMAMAAAMAQKANTKPMKSQLCGRGCRELQRKAKVQTESAARKNGCDVTLRKSFSGLDLLESSPKSALSTVFIMNRETRAINPGSATIPILPDGGSQPPSTPTDPDGFTVAAVVFKFGVDEFGGIALILTIGSAVPHPHGSRLKSA